MVDWLKIVGTIIHLADHLLSPRLGKVSLVYNFNSSVPPILFWILININIIYSRYNYVWSAT